MKTQPVQFQLSPGISHQMIWPYTEREWCVPHDALLFLSVLLRSSAPSSRSPPPLQIIVIFHLSAQTQVHTVQHKRNASKRLTPSRAKLTCQTHIWWWSSLCLPRRCISHLEWWRDMWPVVCVLSTTWSLLGLELWARRDVTVMSQTESNRGESDAQQLMRTTLTSLAISLCSLPFCSSWGGWRKTSAYETTDYSNYY